MEIKNFIKKRNNRLMLIILIIGIAILAVSGIMPERKVKTFDYAGEEERLSEILSQIDGAGRISVMVSYESGEIVDDSRVFASEAAKKKVYPKVRGVIIVAEGASDPAVRQELAAAAAAVTGAGANRVCVYKRDSDQ